MITHRSVTRLASNSVFGIQLGRKSSQPVSLSVLATRWTLKREYQSGDLSLGEIALLALQFWLGLRMEVSISYSAQILHKHLLQNFRTFSSTWIDSTLCYMDLTPRAEHYQGAVLSNGAEA